MWLSMIPSMEIKRTSFSNKIGIRAQNMMYVLSSIININEKTCKDQFNEHNNIFIFIFIFIINETFMQDPKSMRKMVMASTWILLSISCQLYVS
jgi:hypothetical protein